jgi:hypothetical protein
VQQERRREGVALDGVVEARAEGGVAVEGEQGHGFKIPRRVPGT